MAVLSVTMVPTSTSTQLPLLLRVSRTQSSSCSLLHAGTTRWEAAKNPRTCFPKQKGSWARLALPALLLPQTRSAEGRKMSSASQPIPVSFPQAPGEVAHPPATPCPFPRDGPADTHGRQAALPALPAPRCTAGRWPPPAAAAPPPHTARCLLAATGTAPCNRHGTGTARRKRHCMGTARCKGQGTVR